MADFASQGHPAPQAHHRHEPLEIDLRPILMTAGVLLCLALTIHLVLWWQVNHYAAHPQDYAVNLSPLARLPQIPPSPRQQVSPPEDETAFRSANAARLHSYGWVDKRAGVVHIPVERAKDLMLQSGGKL